MSPRQTIIVGSLLLILGVGLWMYTGNFPRLEAGYPGPSLFPRIIAAGLAICGAALLSQGFLKPDPTSSSAGRSWHGAMRLLIGLAVVVGYPFMHAGIGFVPAMSVLIVGIGLLLRASWPWLITSAVMGSGLLYLVFTQGLGVPL